MSYILEALRKAEQQRTLGQIPTLESIHTPPEPRKRRLSPLILLLALLANTGVLGIIHFRVTDRSASATAPEVVFPTGDQASSITEALEPQHAEKPSKEPSAGPPISTEAAALKPFPSQETGSAVPVNAIPAATAKVPATAEIWPPPSLRMLPAEFRRSLPAINVDVHVFSEAPEKRFVLINSKQYREGDQLDEGPLLEAIISEGAILHFRDQTFIIPVHH